MKYKIYDVIELHLWIMGRIIRHEFIFWKFNFHR